jgi:hypothetical protein
MNKKETSKLIPTTTSLLSFILFSSYLVTCKQHNEKTKRIEIQVEAKNKSNHCR